MGNEKRKPLGVVGAVPRLVGSSVGAAAVCAKRILFGHDEETPKKTARPTKNKRKKKRAKESPKHSARKKR